MDNFGFFEIFAGGLAMFYALVKSYGLSIILLTVLVRLLLLPLSIKQTKSMREMAVIQPEIKRLQAKYKGNRQKMNEEMMALYKEHGVNPLGGCLPLLMQFPILIALYYVIRFPLRYLAEETSLASDLMEKALAVNRFLGFRLDCSPSQVLSESGSETIGSVACGSGFASFLPYAAVLLLMGYTTYYQQRQMQAQRGAADNPQMQQMQTFMKIMPVIFVVIGFSFPTGLAFYWVTGNLWMILQQRIILKAAPLPPPDAKGKVAKAAKGGGPKPKPGPKGAKGKATGTGSGGKSGGGKGGKGKPSGGKADAVGDSGAKTGKTNVGDTGSSPNGARRKRKPQPSGSGGKSRPSSKKKRR